jgi:hypothetical protein
LTARNEIVIISAIIVRQLALPQRTGKDIGLSSECIASAYPLAGYNLNKTFAKYS